MIQLLSRITVLAFCIAPLSIHASDVERIALNIDLADCELLSGMPLDEKQSFFNMTHFMQSPGALSLVIGPDCSYLGEVQSIAIIDDPELTIEPKKETLYFIPTINTLFVPYSSKKIIAYAIKLQGDKEPLDYFMDNRKKISVKAAVAKDFAAFAKNVRNPTVVMSSRSSSQKAIVKKPVRRPIRARASSSEIVVPAAPAQAGSSSTSILLAPKEEVVEPIVPTELPHINTPPQSQVFKRSDTVSVAQVIIGTGVVALLVYIYIRKRARDLIVQG